MYARRTFITRIGHACAVGCLLVGTSALAAVNSNGIELLSSSSTGVKSGQYIEAAASVRYQHVNTAERIYTKALVPVSTTTLRKGALSALGRGVMHPGFQIALLAAGFTYDYVTGEVVKPDPNATQYGSYQDPGNWPVSNSWVFESKYFSSPYQGGLYFCTQKFYNGNNFGGVKNMTQLNVNQYKATCECSVQYGEQNCNYSAESTAITKSTNPVNQADINVDEPQTVPVTETDFQTVDIHVPPQLYDELTNDAPIPVWQDEITVLGAPATYVQPTGDQVVAPEVASKAGKWAENIAAQLDGQPLPNPEEDLAGVTAEDKLLEELDLDGPVPPYPNPEVDWQTETLTLPAYSSGIGDGMCPPPASIPLPLGGGTLDWSYQPACDLADMARPAFLGACGLIALLIVLRARGGSD